MTTLTHDRLTPDRILEVGHAFRASKTLLTAVELGIFTALADGPLDAEALRKRAGIHGRCARDFLDALVALGMLLRDQSGRYANSVETDLYLDRNKQTYVGGLLERFSAEQYGLWTSLTTAIRTGMPQCNRSMVSHFAPLYADEAARDRYVSAMTAKTRPVAKALAAAFPWADYDTFIDIGTSQGCLPVEIALAHPHVTGGGFDLPQLAPLFEGYVQEHALSDRLRFYPGTFFNDPLPPAEVLIVGRVLHNWDLATKTMLLEKAYDALPAAGTLIVYERLIDDERRVNAAGLLSSLQMLLASDGGFDFTGADCIGWMRETGFRDIRVEPLTAEQSMVVGIK
jgi:O-methyltransferase domain/Dimerisation domain